MPPTSAVAPVLVGCLVEPLLERSETWFTKLTLEPCAANEHMDHVGLQPAHHRRSEDRLDAIVWIPIRADPPFGEEVVQGMKRVARKPQLGMKAEPFPSKEHHVNDSA